MSAAEPVEIALDGVLGGLLRLALLLLVSVFAVVVVGGVLLGLALAVVSRLRREDTDEAEPDEKS